jgi:hypothetical protein
MQRGPHGLWSNEHFLVGPFHTHKPKPPLIHTQLANNAIGFRGLGLLSLRDVRYPALIVCTHLASFVKIIDEGPQCVVLFSALHIQMFGELFECEPGLGFLRKKCEELFFEIGDGDSKR